MWTQLLSAAALVSVARGMCFGVPPLLQQSMSSCLPPLVYDPSYCICVDPRSEDKIPVNGALRQMSFLANAYPNHKQDKLLALQHRLSMSLPDMANHGYGSSVGDVRAPPFIMFPDRLLKSSWRFLPSILSNEVPRSWKIGGLSEAWNTDAFSSSAGIPTIQSAQKTWGSPSMEISSLMERLHTRRNAWRDATLRRAQKTLVDEELAVGNFLSRHPSQPAGIRPDTPKSLHNFAPGVPDVPPIEFLKEVKEAEARRRNSLLSLKADAMLKSHLDNSLKRTAATGRSNAYVRSLMRLKQAKGQNLS